MYNRLSSYEHLAITDTLALQTRGIPRRNAQSIDWNILPLLRTQHFVGGGFFCIIFNFRCSEKGFWSYKVHERCTQQQNQPASDGYVFFKYTPRDSRARTIGWQIWIKHSHKGIIRRSLQRFILASIIIINKRGSEGCIFKCTIDSRPTDTSLLRTPYHCRQEASPEETLKDAYNFVDFADSFHPTIRFTCET